MNYDVSPSLYEDVTYSNWIDIDKPIKALIGAKKTRTTTTDNTPKPQKPSNLKKHLEELYRYFFHIPDSFIGWYPFAVKDGFEIMRNWKPDIIFSSATPYTSHLVAAKFASTLGIPWIAELRDLWSDNPYRKSGYIDRIIERKTLKFSTGIVTTSEPSAETLRKKYTAPCIEVRNGFDKEDFYPAEPFPRKQKIKILYAGMIYAGKRDPTPLFLALQKHPELSERIEVEFYGPKLDIVSAIAERYGVQRSVTIHPSISRSEILKKQQESDILLLLTWDDIKERGVIPGKLFEYIGASRPILAIGAQTEITAHIIKSEGIGCSSNSPDTIAEFLFNCLDGDLPLKINDSYIKCRDRYSRNLQVEKLSKFLLEHANLPISQ